MLARQRYQICCHRYGSEVTVALPQSIRIKVVGLSSVQLFIFGHYISSCFLFKKVSSIKDIYMQPMLQFCLQFHLKTMHRLLSHLCYYTSRTTSKQEIILWFPDIIHISSGAEMPFQNWPNAPVYNYSINSVIRQCTNPTSPVIQHQAPDTHPRTCAGFYRQ